MRPTTLAHVEPRREFPRTVLDRRRPDEAGGMADITTGCTNLERIMSNTERARRERTAMELALGAGFLFVALAVFVARGTPATTFERSIYASTPVATLLLFVVAITIAVVACVYATAYRRGAGVCLGGTTIVAFVSLPLVRGYHFVGSADPLTHLGWTRDIANGVIAPQTLFYPGYHTFSLAIGRLTGVSLENALLIATVLLFAAFVVHVPLAARVLSSSDRVTGVAAVAAWLVLPINHVATHLLPHTNSLALLFVPVILFALFLYLTRASRSRHFYGLVTPFGVVLAIVSAALVVMHLQHAVNLLLVFVSTLLVQILANRRTESDPIVYQQPLYAQTGLLTALVIGWAATHATTNRALSAVFASLFRGDVGAVTEVAQRGSSLLLVGGSLVGLFVKLFLVSAVFALLTVAYIAVAHTQLISVPDDQRAILTYLAVAFVPLTALFGVYFFGTPKMSFRQVGFIFVVVTVAGAVAFTRIADWFADRTGVQQSVPAVLLVLCLVLSLAVVFPSPYIYKSTPHVTTQDVSGYETAFDTRAGATPYATIGSVPSRYGDAIYGSNENAGTDFSGNGSGFVEPEAFNDGALGDAYPAASYYLVLTRGEVETQVEVYDELNYRATALDGLARDRRVNRVQSNGAFELYLVGNETVT
jgi:hypothetical protein